MFADPLMHSETLILRPKKSRLSGLAVVLVLLAAVFAGAAWFGDSERLTAFHRHGPVWLLLGTLVFGFGAAITLANLLPNATYLKLGSQGLESRSLFRGHLYPWQALGDFCVVKIGTKKLVAVDVAPGLPWRGGFSPCNHQVVGRNALIHFSYPPDELSQVLNTWCRRFHDPDSLRG